MRHIGFFEDEKAARTFAQILFGHRIPAEVREDDPGWAIWVRDDAQVDDARGLLRNYVDSPDDAALAEAFKRGGERLVAEKKKDAEHSRLAAKARRAVRGAEATPYVTAFLIIVSTVLLVATQMGGGNAAFPFLYISEWVGGEPLPEVRQGQIWRLFTPMFLHGGLIHFGFNMYWMWMLGRFIEFRKGPLRMMLIVLFVAGISHVSQYFWGGLDPRFVGMSGVIYGLAGYLYAKGRLDPSDRLGLPDDLFRFFLIWMVLCYTGFLGPIANAAHTMGLVAGLVCGAAESRWPRRQR